MCIFANKSATSSASIDTQSKSKRITERLVIIASSVLVVCGVVSVGSLIFIDHDKGIIALIAIISIFSSLAFLLVGRSIVKYSNSELEEASIRMNNILNNLTEVVVTCDERGFVTSVNPAVKTVLGYNPEDVIGKNVSMLAEEPDRTNHDKYIDNYLKTGKGTILGVAARYVRARKADGKPLDMELTVAEIKNSNVNNRFIGVLRDVTIRKALQESKKMESVGQLTSGVAHDFNNLLGVIVGNLDLISLDMGDNPELQKRIEKAINAANSGSDLTQRLLAFSRQQTLQPKIVDVKKLVNDFMELLNRTLGTSIDIRVNIQENIWPCKVDPAQLEASVLNLAINARDAMAESKEPKLIIEVSNVTFDENITTDMDEIYKGEYVMIAVSDNGSGMTPETQLKCLDPFFTTKPEGKGTGLGLSTTYGFVKQSKGYMRVYSEVGEGTSIKMFFPRVISAETKEDVKEDSDICVECNKDKLVLVVEDKPTMRDFSVNALSRLGFNTLEAESGKEALEVIKNHPDINVLFTDIMMPGGMNGAELAEKVKEIRPDIRVLFTSGFTGVALHAEGHLKEDQVLLEKPFRVSDLEASLKKILGE